MNEGVLVSFALAFLIGGGLCVAAQLLVDLTPFQMTPAHVMVTFVGLGAILSGFGLYKPLAKIGGAGASVPLTGFGHTLMQGAFESMQKRGLVGAFTGGLSETALGLTVAIAAGYLMAVIFRPKG